MSGGRRFVSVGLTGSAITLALNHLTVQVVFVFIPLLRVGTPAGPLVNLVLFVVTTLGLGLSLRRRVGQEDADPLVP